MSTISTPTAPTWGAGSSDGHEQSNVHLPLNALTSPGVVIKDAEASPHRYRLSPT